MSGIRDQILSTRICTECGQELEPGLRNTVAHMDSCKRNAPNESIESHERAEKQKGYYDAEQRLIDAIYNVCTVEEKRELSLLSIGIPMFGNRDKDEPMVMMMGSRQFFKRQEFIFKMKIKYSLR